MISLCQADTSRPADQDGTTVAAPAPSLPVPVMTASQIEAFGQLVGEPQGVVSRHLQLDPGLIPLAVDAANEHTRRKRSGRIRAWVGFSIFGAGAIVGDVVMESTDTMGCDVQQNACLSERGDRLALGIIFAVVSASVGLGIGIPGLVRMGKQSQAEYYAHRPGLLPARHSHPRGAGQTPVARRHLRIVRGWRGDQGFHAQGTGSPTLLLARRRRPRDRSRHRLRGSPAARRGEVGHDGVARHGLRSALVDRAARQHQPRRRPMLPPRGFAVRPWFLG
jgi:hypothetical protein